AAMLRVRDLAVGHVRGLSLTLRGGEVLGVAGVGGSGGRAVLGGLGGLRPLRGGGGGSTGGAGVRPGGRAERRRGGWWGRRWSVTGVQTCALPICAAMLRVRDLAVGHVRGLSLTLRGGEVLGVAGLVGSGRSAVLEGLAGLRPLRGGVVERTAVPVLVPEDRL